MKIKNISNHHQDHNTYQFGDITQWSSLILTNPNPKNPEHPPLTAGQKDRAWLWYTGMTGNRQDTIVTLLFCDGMELDVHLSNEKEPYC